APDRLVTPDLIARAAHQRLLVMIWHEERRAVLDRLVTLPVIGICTDKPEMMNRYTPRPDQGTGQALGVSQAIARQMIT
ncbi:MAG TPA: hypothetical protein VIZ17_15820, partial [Acetobacteraceae bacterium]